jgi:hypothetical protein
MAPWWNDTQIEKREVLGKKKPVPVPLCPVKISHGLVSDRTRTSVIEDKN